MNELIIKDEKIEEMIYEIRGKQVMLDSDVAKLFKYEIKNLNRQVQRNIERFPENYCFQLTKEEYNVLRCQNGTLKNTQGKHRKYLPYVFTEYGITMLAGVLKSEVAIKASLKIIDAFIAMRKYISSNLIEQRYINKQVLKNTEDIQLLQESFKKFEEKKKINEIYYEGQIYDAYSKILDILSMAKKEIIIIDAYADKNVLDIISKLNVKVILICKNNGLIKKIDIDKYNSQYSNLVLLYNDSFHDRYFIIDDSKVYHCGTSINHAGSKTFSINYLTDKLVIESLLNKIHEIK